MKALILTQMITSFLKLPLRLAETAVPLNYGHGALPNFGLARAG
jgi:hypothetical protein